MTAVSKQRIAKGVGVTVFVALLSVGFAASIPAPGASALEWIGAAAKSLIVAAIGSTVIVAFLVLWVAGVWVWSRTMKAFGRVPRWHDGWILNAEYLSDEGKAARLWLLRVYGTIAVAGVLAHTLQMLGVL